MYKIDIVYKKYIGNKYDGKLIYWLKENVF